VIGLATANSSTGDEMTEPNIKNVFVLMLENHSFDNIFAMSGIQDINAATVHDWNSYQGEKYLVQDGAPPCMTTDPGHEFKDVLEQLCGADAACKYKGGAYPTVNNLGFASSYATSITEDTGTLVRITSAT
jgi:phospholipase C